MNNRFSFQGPEKKPQLIVLPMGIRPKNWKNFPDVREGYVDVSHVEGIISLSAAISRERIFETLCRMIDQFSGEECGLNMSLHNQSNLWDVYESDLMEKTVLLSKLQEHEDLLVDEGGVTIGVVDNQSVIEVGPVKLLTVYKDEGNLQKEKMFLEEQGIPAHRAKWLDQFSEMDVYSTHHFRKRIEILMTAFSLEEVPMY